MAKDNTVRFNNVKQAVAEECQKLFEKLCRHSDLPDELKITLSALYRETAEISECETSVAIPKRINYKSAGRLIGKIRDYQVSVINDGDGHSMVTIEGKEHLPLRLSIVEQQLGIPVQKKRSGPQLGRPSETVGRAVWRHLADHYNRPDRTVQYEPIKE